MYDTMNGVESRLFGVLSEMLKIFNKQLLRHPSSLTYEPFRVTHKAHHHESLAACFCVEI